MSVLTKKQVLKAIREMPGEFQLDEVIDRIVLIHKIQKGSHELHSGKGLSTDDAKKRLKKWLK
jgi:hypothetical protein